MNKFYLLPIIALLSTGLANAISQETIDCTKVYAAGQAISLATKPLAPFSMTIETIGRAGSLVGSPIRSVFSTAFHTAMIPIAYSPKLNVEMTVNSKLMSELTARDAVAGSFLTAAAIKSIPAVIGFSVIPSLIKKHRERSQQ